MPLEKTRKSTSTELVDCLPPDNVLYGRSTAMQAVQQRAKKICATNVPVLLSGDGGTGKDVLARWIHKHSLSNNGQFVKVNCAAIPGELLESELFGYEKGAFTGAQVAKPGRVELAHNGTLFLDGIEELDIGLQTKLLHFLQDSRFSRIGGETERAVETRIICSTSKDLEQEIHRGKFRIDLFYRIGVVQLRLPRLQERREDIPVLAEYFRLHYEKHFVKESKPFSEEMLRFMQNLSWPGNMWELSNDIARYVLMGPEAAVMYDGGTQKQIAGPTAIPAKAGTLKGISKDAVRELERSVILETLRANQWTRRKTAQVLKISYRALIYKIRQTGLAPSRNGSRDSASRRSSTGLSADVDLDRP
jgi:two-component system response regulator AtoC